MSRLVLILASEKIRDRAISWVRGAPKNTRLEFKEPKRTLDQNSKMWAMLSDVARQVPWHGLTLSADDWKLLFMDALGHEMRLVPNLAGNGFLNIGRSSSDLSKREMSDLIELLYMWGADPAHPVKWSEPLERAA